MPQFMFWVWLGVIVAATVIELVTWNMTSIWFAAAGIVALILSIFKAITWEIQLAVFVVLSVTLILSLRRICRKWLLQRTEGKTNTDIYIGMQFKMLKAATPDESGEIRINDVIWSAKSEDNNPIGLGERVEIVRVSGNKMIVKKINL